MARAPRASFVIVTALVLPMLSCSATLTGSSTFNPFARLTLTSVSASRKVLSGALSIAMTILCPAVISLTRPYVTSVSVSAIPLARVSLV
jgi:hypothetical protein